jgi:glucose/arabinose dehydrogenase
VLRFLDRLFLEPTMTLCRCAAAAAGLVAILGADTRAQPAPNGSAAAAPEIVEVQGGQIRVVTVATGLVHPWSLAFLPDGRSLLVAERAGQLRIIRDDALDPEPVWTAPAPASPEAPVPGAPTGPDLLKWIALHPRFAENNLVYLSHPVSGERGTTLAVARGRFDGAKLVDVNDIFVADAWETGGNMAGKILFGPDETLYVTVGDRDRLCCNGTDDNSLRLKAQDLGSHVGKTLRIRDDGSVPPDNPFVGRTGARPEIFTYGHRNGYGLAFHPETGELWQVEIGPMGGDEVNILLPGHNYGWPVVSMGRNYTGTLVSDQPFHRDGMDDPRMFWVPSISPSSLGFYTGEMFPQWRNDMLVGALNGQSLQRIAFGQPSQAERREPLLRRLELRIRDVQQSPDGYIYVATERSFQGSDANGTVLRLEPVL